MRFHFTVVLAIISIGFNASTGRADTDNGNPDVEAPYKIAAQKIIDKCWAMSEEEISSGVTSRMRQGTLDSAQCLKDHIILLAEKYLYPQSPELIDQTKQDLTQAAAAYSGLYWNLYNQMDSCRPSCGTMHYVRSDAAYAYLLQNILSDIYRQMQYENINIEAIEQ